MVKLYNSSKIRVEPVFSHIKKENQWEKFLMWVAEKTATKNRRGLFQKSFANDKIINVCFSDEAGGRELAIAPNPDLLRFLLSDSGIELMMQSKMYNRLSKKPREKLNFSEKARLRLFDIATRREELLRINVGRDLLKEYTFEGLDYPDVAIITDTIVLLIEGKLTESHLTTHTTWLDARDQMIRHLDSAMACNSFMNKQVFGMYIVGDEKDKSILKSGRKPSYEWGNYEQIEYWRASLPQYDYNTPDGKDQIDKRRAGYLGFATWNDLGNALGKIKVPLDTVSGETLTLA
jgi:hypothetical protein